MNYQKVLLLVLSKYKSISFTYQADADGTVHMQLKAKGRHRALDAVCTKVDPRLHCLIDEIVNDVDKCKLHPDPTDTQEGAFAATFRDQPDLTHVEMTVTMPDVGATEQEDLHSRFVTVQC
jgi:hypothetical protein